MLPCDERTTVDVGGRDGGGRCVIAGGGAPLDVIVAVSVKKIEGWSALHLENMAAR